MTVKKKNFIDPTLEKFAGSGLLELLDFQVQVQSKEKREREKRKDFCFSVRSIMREATRGSVSQRGPQSDQHPVSLWKDRGTKSVQLPASSSGKTLQTSEQPEHAVLRGSTNTQSP